MKRLLLSACLAAGVHAMLFSIRPQWSPPAMLMPQSRSVAISLVNAPKAPPQKPVLQPVVKPEPKKKPKPKPTPRPVKAPEPEPEPMPAPEPTPRQQIQATDMDALEEKPAPEQAQQSPPPSRHTGATIQTSVPRYDINPTPVYPPVALRRGYEGTVMLEVLVTPEGRAAQVEVVQSSGYVILDRRARDTVQKWLFTPALRGSEPVEMRVAVPVIFQLK